MTPPGTSSSMRLLNLTWRWHRPGQSPSDDDCPFLVSLIDHAAQQCSEPATGCGSGRAGPGISCTKALC